MNVAVNNLITLTGAQNNLFYIEAFGLQLAIFIRSLVTTIKVF